MRLGKAAEFNQVLGRWDIWTVLNAMLIFIGLLGLFYAWPFTHPGGVATYVEESRYGYSWLVLALQGWIAPVLMGRRLYMLAIHKGVAIAVDEGNVFLVNLMLIRVPRAEVIHVALERDSTRGALGARRRRLVLTLKNGKKKSLLLLGSQERPEDVRDALLTVLQLQP